MGVGRPDLTATAGPSRRVCHLHGICGLASTATSRCRCVRPGCPFVQGPQIEPKEGAPTSRTASPSPPTAHRQHPRPVANLAFRGRPNVESQRRWGGSTPTTPLLSVRGCKWGSTPLGSISHQTWSEHVERVQVRVAALAERLGGFGTCAPGTWSSRAHIPTVTPGSDRPPNGTAQNPETGHYDPSARTTTISHLGRLKPHCRTPVHRERYLS